MPHSAPDHVNFCARCGSAMITRQVGDKPRRACPQCGYIHFTDPKVGVGVVVMHEGKLLLVRRAMKPEQGKWSLPAGFLDYGEDPQAVAVRETYEETNLRVQIDHLIDVFHNKGHQGGASIFILYEATLLSGTLQAGDDADAAGFFELNSLPEIAFESTRMIVRQRLRMQK